MQIDARSSLLANNKDPILLHGSASGELARNVAKAMGIPLSNRDLGKFPDGEIHVRVDDSVRGRDAYIIQSTCPPVNEHLMELFIMIDTLRRASAESVTAIIPYYGYARQDRKVVGREPITAKLIANLVSAAGADRVLCVDLHSPAIQGFFEIGMDHLTAVHSLARYIRGLNLADAVVVSPDTGGVKRADTFAGLLGLPLAILHKRRSDAEQVNIQAVIGDVRGKRAILVDDIIATGGTIVKAADALLRAGALPDITVTATHAVLAGNACKLLSQPAIKRIIVTDSVPIAPAIREQLPSLQIVSLAPLLADAIWHLHRKESLSILFKANSGDEVAIPWPL